MALAIIGGSSLLESDLFAHLENHTVTTPHGLVRLHLGDGLIFCQRHHAHPDGHYAPPHRINQHAILTALKNHDAKRIVAFCSVGGLKTQFAPGTLVVPDDCFNLWNPTTLFNEDRRGHIVPGFDADLRGSVVQALRAEGLTLLDRGVYTQTIGPRFETRAEVRFLATVADVVGMTGEHEATLARELDIPYAMACMVDNFAHGIEASELTMRSFEDTQRANRQVVERAVGSVIKHVGG